MTRIDFYVVASSAQEERLAFVCKWVQKAYRAGKKVFIAVDNEKQANYLDNLLWQFEPESFLPHDCEGKPASLAPVKIGFSGDCGDFHDCLVNLCADIPGFFSRFERVAEVVCQEERILEQTRRHYSFYQERHHPIQTHRLSVSQTLT